MSTKGIEKLRQQQPALGTWLSVGSPTIAELAARCGFDWLLFDLEHGCLTEADLLSNLRAASGYPAALVVRVPDHGASLIGRALDWGAEVIMVPHVDQAESAQKLVQAMTHAPHGKRGFSRSVRALGYGRINPSEVPAPLLWTQIETAEGVRNVEAIAAVRGVHGLFVGPADLKLSLASTPGAPSFEESLDRVIHAARTHGIAAGILIRDPAEFPGLQQRGFTQIAVDSDLAILRQGFLAIAEFGLRSSD